MKLLIVLSTFAFSLGAYLYVSHDNTQFRHRMACDDAMFYYNLASDNPDSLNVAKYRQLAQDAALKCIPKECLKDVKECK